MPESVERFYGRPDVLFRPLVGVDPAGVALVWRRSSENPAVESFVEVTKKVLGSQVPPAAPAARREAGMSTRALAPAA